MPRVLWAIVIKTTVAHTVSYFIAGLVAFRLFHYAAVLTDPASGMRPPTHLMVRAGVLFQPIRGLLFGVVFYLLRDALFGPPLGWLVIWLMLVFVGILSTFAPAPMSIEGFIYNEPTGARRWGGLTEVLSQSLLLSVVTFYWVNHPEAAWISWVLGVLCALALALPALGLLAARSTASETPHTPTAT